MRRALHPRPKGEAAAGARSFLVPRRPPPEEVKLPRPEQPVFRAAKAEQVTSSSRRRRRRRQRARRARRGPRRTRWFALLEVEVEIAAVEKEIAIAERVFR